MRSMLAALGVGLLLLTVVFVLSRFEGGGDLLRLFGRQDTTWQAMHARGVWRVGMDPSFPPFQSLDEAGVPAGYDVDLARALAQAWGLELEIVALGYDSLLDALQAGRIDSVVSALPYDPRATRDFAFSPPYFEAGIRLAVAADSPRRDELEQAAQTGQTSGQPPDPWQDTRALAGLTLAVEWGSMGDMVARRLRREDETIQVAPFETSAEAIQAMLQEPGIDGLLLDNVSLRQAQGQGAPLVPVGPALEGNAYVIAMPIRAATLQAQIGETLVSLHADGTLAQLEDAWFGPVGSQTE